MPEKQENPLCVLAIGEFASDRILLHDVCRASGWQLNEARDRRSAMRVLERLPVQVVVAESDLPNWNWKKVLGDLRRLAATAAIDRHFAYRRRLSLGRGFEHRRV